MNRGQKFFAFLGRVLISAIFLLSGVHKIMDWQGSETFITNLICDLHASIINYPMIETVLENLLPYNTIILIVVVVCSDRHDRRLSDRQDITDGQIRRG